MEIYPTELEEQVEEALAYDAARLWYLPPVHGEFQIKKMERPPENLWGLLAFGRAGYLSFRPPTEKKRPYRTSIIGRTREYDCRGKARFSSLLILV